MSSAALRVPVPESENPIRKDETGGGRPKWVVSKALIDSYRERFFQVYLKDLESAICANNDIQVGQIGHKLEGSAPLYGWVQLGSLAKDLQKAAAEQSWTKVQEIVNAMKLYMHNS